MQLVKFVTRVNIRATPSLKGKIQRVMAAGDVGVTWLPSVTMDDHSWYEIQLKNGEVGWGAIRDGNVVLFELSDLPLEFNNAIEFTLRWEGGYVNNPADPGGETKFGISKLRYPMLDIKNLTVEQAKALYFLDYWMPTGAANYPYPKDLLMLDIGVLCGVGKALAYKEVGPLTICHKQFAYFSGLSSFTIFGRGWINRTNDLLGTVIKEFEDTNG